MAVFKGSGVALVTPFNEKGVNFDCMHQLIEMQIQGGTSAIFTLGTTGEPSTMTDTEKNDVIDFTVKTVKGRIPVFVGSGGNDTAKVISMSQNAEKRGADGLLVVTPYYNKCTQNGLVAHYRAVAQSVGIPLICYNVPSRTGVNILPSTALKLCEIKNMAGLKEASGNIETISETARLIRGSDMALYSGDDALATMIMLLGGSGLISVAANAVPEKISRLISLCLNREWEKAQIEQFELAPFIKALFSEVNPIPIKKAVNLLGYGAGDPRMPLTPMEEENSLKLADTMRRLNLI